MGRSRTEDCPRFARPVLGGGVHVLAFAGARPLGEPGMPVGVSVRYALPRLGGSSRAAGWKRRDSSSLIEIVSPSKIAEWLDGPS